MESVEAVEMAEEEVDETRARILARHGLESMEVTLLICHDPASAEPFGFYDLEGRQLEWSANVMVLVYQNGPRPKECWSRWVRVYHRIGQSLRHLTVSAPSHGMDVFAMHTVEIRDMETLREVLAMDLDHDPIIFLCE